MNKIDRLYSILGGYRDAMSKIANDAADMAQDIDLLMQEVEDWSLEEAHNAEYCTCTVLDDESYSDELSEPDVTN